MFNKDIHSDVKKFPFYIKNKQNTPFSNINEINNNYAKIQFYYKISFKQLYFKMALIFNNIMLNLLTTQTESVNDSSVQYIAYF